MPFISLNWIYFVTLERFTNPSVTRISSHRCCQIIGRFYQNLLPFVLTNLFALLSIFDATPNRILFMVLFHFSCNQLSEFCTSLFSPILFYNYGIFYWRAALGSDLSTYVAMATTINGTLHHYSPTRSCDARVVFSMR